MSSVVSFGTNTNAQRKRVMYVGTSVIYEGMPVCYDDSTTNVLGIDTGASNAVSTTTTEGGQNEGKFLRVENPDADNIGLFAGVVAHGPKVGTTGVAAGVWLDVFIPNGAIVPVRAGVACTTRRTVLSVISATQYLGHALSATQARPVAIAEETYDRSTAGLVLAKLDPNMFIYQDGTGDSLYVGVGATAAAASQIMNRINVSSAQTAGAFTAFEIKAALTSTAAPTGVGIALYTQTDISGILAGQAAGVSHWTNIGAGGDLTGEYYALEVGIYESGADLSGQDRISPLVLRTQLDGTNGPSAGHYMMTFICDGAGDHPDAWFSTNEKEDIAMSLDATGTNQSGAIAFKIGPPGSETTHYIHTFDATAGAT